MHPLCEMIATMLDDAAALGNPKEAEALASALDTLSTAAGARATGIEFRLRGDIQDASYGESQSETWLKVASRELEQLSCARFESEDVEDDPEPAEVECEEGGHCQFTPDLEYDPSGETINCEKCGGYPPQD